MQKNEEKPTLKRIGQLNKKHQSYLYIYLENLERLNKSPHTIKSYQNDLLQFLEWIEYGTKKLRHVNAEIIGKYLDFLANGGEVIIVEKPIVRAKNFLKRMFSFKSTNKLPIIPNKRISRLQPLGVASRKRHISCLKNFFEFLKQRYEDSGNILKQILLSQKFMELS